jgi:serine/threonine-protein kinase
LRVSANGGKPEVLIDVKGGEAVAGPQLLPGGDALLFTSAPRTSGATNDRWESARIVVQNLKSGERKTLIEGGTDARYVPTGHIVYALGATLYAVSFDARKLQVSGGQTPIVEGVMRAGAGTGAAHYHFSDTGTLVYVPGSVEPLAQLRLALIDRAGTVKPLGIPAGLYRMPRISPDGKKIAFESTDGKEEFVALYDLSGASSVRRLTFGSSNFNPIWSGDGQRIVFRSDRDGDPSIFWQPADGSGSAERLVKPEAGGVPVPDSWAPKAQILAFSVGTGLGDVALKIFSLADKKSSDFLAVPKLIQARSVFSPDGRWIAYVSNETGNLNVFVKPFPDTGAKYQVSKDVGGQPLWSPDGKELFYRGGTGNFFSVKVSTQPGFTTGNPTPLPIDNTIALPEPTSAIRNYDITPDGKYFIIVTRSNTAQPEARATSEMQFVLNWFTELQQRVPR